MTLVPFRRTDQRDVTSEGVAVGVEVEAEADADSDARSGGLEEEREAKD